MLDGLRRHHGTHIRSSGWIPNVAGASADQCDWLVSCFLQTLHQTQRHKMSYMQTIRGGIEPDIESCLSRVHQFFDLIFIRHLGD